MGDTFLISYDLGVPETAEDYKKIINYIKSFGNWAKPLQSVWLVKSSTKGCADIRDDIKKLIDSNDKVLVIKITGDNWASYNLSKEVVDWMKNNI